MIPGQTIFYNQDNPLPCHTVIIDEILLIDIRLMWHVLMAIGNQTQSSLVGIQTSYHLSAQAMSFRT